MNFLSKISGIGEEFPGIDTLKKVADTKILGNTLGSIAKKKLDLKKYLFDNNYLIHLQTPIINRDTSELLGYLMIYLVNPNMIIGKTPIKAENYYSLQWGTFKKNLDRIIITDPEGNVLWNMGSWCRLFRLGKCAGKNLQYDEDIIGLMEVSLEDITLDHIAESKGPAAVLIESVRNKEYEILKSTATTLGNIETLNDKLNQKFSTRQWAEANVRGYGTRWKKDVKNEKTLSEFILFIIYMFMDGRKNWLKRNKTKDILEKLPFEQYNIKLGETILAKNPDMEIDKEGVSLVLKTSWLLEKKKLKRVHIIGKESTTPGVSAFGRKNVMRKINNFGIKFIRGKFTQRGKTISWQKAYSIYFNSIRY